ncbi:Lysozyme G,Glycine, glutamate and proline-rich protein,Lysozyme g [Mytilus edulis]|uniref:Lysozyme g n=1 Tax=Mytilus edulis TaxID=6550 RepID=A0A8S3TNN9_MYTED|nr:Lysozyme G,Glycine, glutamate and proline-rich protein,Lysozyme g [Mytilus edulis]
MRNFYVADHNGDMTQLHPTGMVSAYGGVAGSCLAIDRDIDELNKRKACYIQAGEKNGIPPAVIAAIASRESRAGRLLYKTNGWGDHHNAYGIMQCDINANPLQSIYKTCTSYNWDSCDHINAMVEHVLSPNIQAVKRKHPSWSDAQALQGGVAAYNFGVGNVQSWSGLDVGSTNNDYSNDVIARAQYLISHYHW